MPVTQKRTLEDHIVEGDSINHQLEVTVEDAPGAGGANHHYLVSYGGAIFADLLFQDGPVKEKGVNGITQEVLLAIVIDRLRGFQSGQFKCVENAAALSSCESALHALQMRTRARISRGVEGTNQQ